MKELLLNPTRLVEVWKEEHEQRQQDNAAIYEDLARIERKVEEHKELLAKVLDRLDALSNNERDADERAYYEQKRDTIKQMLYDLREEYRELQTKVTNASIPEETIRGLTEMGDEYRGLLERDDLDRAFKRGLVEDRDIRGAVLYFSIVCDFPRAARKIAHRKNGMYHAAAGKYAVLRCGAAHPRNS